MGDCTDYKRHEVECDHQTARKMRWRTSDGCQGSLCADCLRQAMNRGLVPVALTEVDRRGIPVKANARSYVEAVIHVVDQGRLEETIRVPVDHAGHNAPRTGWKVTVRHLGARGNGPLATYLVPARNFDEAVTRARDRIRTADELEILAVEDTGWKVLGLELKEGS